MDQQHGPAVAIEKGMAIGEQAHDEPRAGTHLRLVLPTGQPILDRTPAVLWMAKIHSPFDDGLLRHQLGTVFARPRVERLEQKPMHGQKVAVANALALRQIRQCRRKLRPEKRMLNRMDDGKVLFRPRVAQIACGFEISERVKHALF